MATDTFFFLHESPPIISENWLGTSRYGQPSPPQPASSRPTLPARKREPLLRFELVTSEDSAPSLLTKSDSSQQTRDVIVQGACKWKKKVRESVET